MSVPANFYDTYDVIASPADDAETVIAILGGVGQLLPGLAVHLHAWVETQLDGDATAVVLTVRRDNIDGEQVGNQAEIGFTPSGTFTAVPCIIEVVDNPGDFAGAIYVLTATCTDASGASTVNNMHFDARVC